MRKLKTSVSILLLSFALLLSPQQGDKLKAINSEIEAINKKLDHLKKDENSLLNGIYKIELNYEKARIENNKVKMQLRNTGDEIKKQEIEKGKIETEIQLSKKNLKKVLRILYKIGGNSYLKMFVRVDSLDQLFKNYRMFISLINYKSDELNTLKANILRLDQVNKDLKTNHNQLVKLQKLKQQKMRNIRNLKRGKLTLIRSINNDRKNYLKLLEELKDEASRLNTLISGKQIKRPMKTLDLNRIKGRLKWPLKGKVISSFGKKRSTKFNTYIINNGIKIKPTGSANVRSIYPGEVVFADYFKGYGNLIIVQHSKNFYSLYGYNEKMFKAKGDNVRDGEMISVAGDSGSTSGKVLYFEIRTQSIAQNPLQWLRKRREKRN